jgi:hypothetical protein
MNLLISDNAKAEVSLKSQDICRTLFIQTWQLNLTFNTRTTVKEDGNAKSQCEQVDEYVRASPDMATALCHVCMIMNCMQPKVSVGRLRFKCLQDRSQT